MANLYDDEENVPPPNPQGPPQPPVPGGGVGVNVNRTPGLDVGYPEVNFPYGPGGGGPGEGEFDFPDYGGAGRPHYNFPGVPAFKSPKFSIPTLAEAQAEPGYQFRLGQGEEALQASAAARGVLRTGATLQDILKYGQEFAASEYQNVFNRAVQNWNIQQQRAQSQYAPLYGQYLNQFGAEQQAGLAAFQRQWDQYLQQFDEFKFIQQLGYPQVPQIPRY